MNLGKHQILGIIETILEGFAKVGILKNESKRHLGAVMNIELKK